LDYTPWVHKKLNKEGKLMGYNDLPPCTFGVPIIDWINRADVRQSLHIPDKV
jgi:serine carboxypeptidase-like clade 1